MLDFTIKTDANGQEYLETSMTGKALLSVSQLNKGTAFTPEERHTFKLMGKLPNKVETLDEQVHRAYLQYQSFDKQINRNTLLNSILDVNQVLFYRLVQDHMKEMIPTLYTPVVGNVVQTFSEKFMNPRGLYIAYPDRDHIEAILDNRSNPNIQLIVVSDGEGVLGIGDQGIGAMAIPVAKLMVYTAFAGINPLNTLPILLDAGTNNETLLQDPLYLGWAHRRLAGDQYGDFIDQFIHAVKKKFPHVFLHWEDFGRTNAYRNLIKYRQAMCSFNDDIQGTGVVTTAAVLAAVKKTPVPLADQRIVIYGAGTAGMGVVDNLCRAFCQLGLQREAVKKQFWLIDKSGLLTVHSTDITPSQQPYLRTAEEIQTWSVKNKQSISLLEVVKHVKPTLLIGTSAQGGAFTQPIVETMARYVERPIIFPLSNPTEKCEADPTQLLQWTQGQALIATGSPFEDVQYQAHSITISQCNNYLAFPGIGLGVIAIQAQRVTDNMLLAASGALAHATPTDHHALLPSIEEAPSVSKQIAISVAEAAIQENVAGIAIDQPVEKIINNTMWKPHYLPYRKQPQG